MELKGKFALGLVAIAVTVLIGTVGYHLLAGWPWFECLYMTVITLSTIGYGELPGMTQSARYFTVGLVVLSISTVGYTVTVFTQFLIQSEILSLTGRRRVLKMAGKLHRHYIICGAGRVGSRIAQQVAAEGGRFLIIEKDSLIAEQMLQRDYLVLLGDATSEETLKSAGIKYARGIVCAASSDAENVYTALLARDLNPGIFIVARANEESAESKLIKAGANKVVCPSRIGSHQMARALLKPEVSEYIELATTSDTDALGLEAIRISPHADFIQKTLKESEIRSRLNLIIVAIRREQGEMLFNPSGETLLLPGDLLFATGKRSSLLELENLSAGRSPRPV